ncbi:UvrD-helicase domain-containing protein [Streptomyces sp. DSM 42041]|uniref:DNA 3'-5' helicase n=1 Tax=Streptomyces hazeniae TaxID=3075538 RepID=A0ABU2NZN3_9ACTN|nr:UvrD-helicase domain-containing protein [Streptomyces sp. DSM 42041]MDT0382438.1 UvrD-helicase domain-containing protein [Streptomyces sp. DSM 42041]
MSTPTAHTPTDEQTAAVDAFKHGDHLALQAGAGTGKTTTLALLASATQARGRYIAFNKAIATAAAAAFPPNVVCKTAHAMAFAAIGHRYLPRLNAPRTPTWKTGAALGITKPLRIGDRDVSERALSNAALKTVTHFCHSVDTHLRARHVPRLRGLEDDTHHAALAHHVLPYARKAWADLQHPREGVVRFDHDHYLKIWALSDPKIPADFLLLDEAQDTNPVLEGILTAQRGHAQLVIVGDSAQAIYGWRGARDVMTGFAGTHLHLSQSFRFGPHLAEEANRWLAIADAPIRLTGTPTLTTTIGDHHQPTAILCRTNVGAMIQVFHHLATGHRVALTGGGAALQALAHAARDLKAGQPTTHPELLLFRTWGELQDYAEHDPSGRDLAPLVDLVDTHGTDAILNAVNQLSHEAFADITVSTAHKAKGREWPVVRIADDFTEPAPSPDTPAAEDGTPQPGPIDTAEARLSYVAVTRARQHLDLGGLNWIDHHPDGNPTQPRPHDKPLPTT